MAQGRVPFLKFGRSVRFRLSDVLEKLNAFRVNLKGAVVESPPGNEKGALLHAPIKTATRLAYRNSLRTSGNDIWLAVLGR